MADIHSTIDEDGWLSLQVPVTVKTALSVACPPSWLAAPKFQILDRNAEITLTRRLSRMRTSGAMQVVKILENTYYTHAALCRFDADTKRLELPRHIVAAFAPLPAQVIISNDDGHLTVRPA